MVFDLAAATVNLVLHGQSWCNIHPQYSRSHDPVESHDILVQENHGNRCDNLGNFLDLGSGLGADIHVIRDDGQHVRGLPWGRDEFEQCQGHQCWRGRSHWAITGTGLMPSGEAQLIESRLVQGADHSVLLTPDGECNHLSREFCRLV